MGWPHGNGDDDIFEKVGNGGQEFLQLPSLSHPCEIMAYIMAAQCLFAVHLRQSLCRGMASCRSTEASQQPTATMRTRQLPSVHAKLRAKGLNEF